jgi:hypothetical protein
VGLLRKITSISTLGLIDFRSDKERIAAYTKGSRRELRKQTRMMRAETVASTLASRRIAKDLRSEQALRAQIEAQVRAELGVQSQITTTHSETQESQQLTGKPRTALWKRWWFIPIELVFAFAFLNALIPDPQQPSTTLPTSPKAPTTAPATTPPTTLPPKPNALALENSSTTVAPPSSFEVRSTQLDAFRVCKDIVKLRLKAPSTATFRNPSENDGEVLITNYAEPDLWDVNSTVDSENSFGAKIRTRFRCSVYDRGNKWELDSFEFID